MRVLEILSDSNRGGAGVYLENYAANASPDTEIVAALPQGAGGVFPLFKKSARGEPAGSPLAFFVMALFG